MSKEVIHVYDGEHKHIPQPAAPEPPVHPDAENFWSHQEEMWQKAKEEEARLKLNRDILNGRIAPNGPPSSLSVYDIEGTAEDKAELFWAEKEVLVDPSGPGRTFVLTTLDASQPPKRKIDWRYIPWDALEDVALAMQIGAEKHPGSDDYLEGSHTYKDLSSGLLRHYAAWAQGDDVDQDGFHHLAGVAARCLMLIALHKRGRGDLDDR